MSTINVDQLLDRAVMTLCNASGELRQCQRDLLDLRRMMPGRERIGTASALLTLCRINRQQQRAASAKIHALHGFGGAV